MIQWADTEIILQIPLLSNKNTNVLHLTAIFFGTHGGLTYVYVGRKPY